MLASGPVGPFLREEVLAFAAVLPDAAAARGVRAVRAESPESRAAALSARNLAVASFCTL